MWVILAIIIFTLVQITKKKRDQNNTREFLINKKEKYVNKICAKCGNEYGVKESNLNNGLFKTCTSCRNEVIEQGKSRKKRILTTYLRNEDFLKLKALEIKGNDFMINADLEYQRLKSFYYTSPTEKGSHFENYVADVLKLNHFKSVKVMPVGPDNGIDIVAIKNELTYGIQCKFFNDTKVGNQTILQFYGSILNEGFDRGLFITTTDFTKSALNLKFLEDKDIDLLDFGRFHEEYILPIKPKECGPVYYEVLCENYKCENVVRHDLMETTCICGYCGKVQELHNNYLDYFTDNYTR